jgi:hypothetical protein
LQKRNSLQNMKWQPLPFSPISLFQKMR